MGRDTKIKNEKKRKKKEKRKKNRFRTIHRLIFSAILNILHTTSA
jgi:hypothetical protein